MARRSRSNRLHFAYWLTTISRQQTFSYHKISTLLLLLLSSLIFIVVVALALHSSNKHKFDLKN